MTQTRTANQKANDCLAVYGRLREELTPTQMRTLITKMTEMQPDDKADMAAYTSLVQASLHLARVVAANDRTAMLAAAMLTQGGVSRPVIDASEE